VVEVWEAWVEWVAVACFKSVIPFPDHLVQNAVISVFCLLITAGIWWSAGWRCRFDGIVLSTLRIILLLCYFLCI